MTAVTNEGLPWRKIFSYISDPMDLFCLSHTCTEFRSIVMEDSRDYFRRSSFGHNIAEETVIWPEACDYGKQLQPGCVHPELATALFLSCKRLDNIAKERNTWLREFYGASDSSRAVPAALELLHLAVDEAQTIFHRKLRLAPILDKSSRSRVPTDREWWFRQATLNHAVNCANLPLVMNNARETNTPPYLVTPECERAYRLIETARCMRENEEVKRGKRTNYAIESEDESHHHQSIIDDSNQQYHHGYSPKRRKTNNRRHH